MKLVEAIKNKEEQETQVIWSDTCPECGEKATYTEVYGYGQRLEYDWVFNCPSCNYTKHCPDGNILGYHSLMERENKVKRADLRLHKETWVWRVGDVFYDEKTKAYGTIIKINKVNEIRALVSWSDLRYCTTETIPDDTRWWIRKIDRKADEE